MISLYLNYSIEDVTQILLGNVLTSYFYINTLILQDADNLDAIGAIGIGRSFAYATLNNQIFYDDKIPLEQFEGYE